MRMMQRIMEKINKGTEVEAAIVVVPLGTVTKANYYITKILTRFSVRIYLQKEKMI